MAGWHSTPRLRQELVTQHILADEKEASFRALTGPGCDDVWTEAACHVIRLRRPHLLLFHLLNSDGIHHRYGAESPASYTALALADFYGRKKIVAPPISFWSHRMVMPCPPRPQVMTLSCL